MNAKHVLVTAAMIGLVYYAYKMYQDNQKAIAAAAKK